jgi:hypothetical protein
VVQQTSTEYSSSEKRKNQYFSLTIHDKFTRHSGPMGVTVFPIELKESSHTQRHSPPRPWWPYCLGSPWRQEVPVQETATTNPRSGNHCCIRPPERAKRARESQYYQVICTWHATESHSRLYMERIRVSRNLESTAWRSDGSNLTV